MSRIAAPFLLVPLILAACAEPTRSRDLANPRVAPEVLAQQVCSNCHGVTGVSISPNFPNLAAQQPTYLVAQLQQFKSHNREDPAGFEYMWGLSRSLTEEQMQGLARYYAAQPAPLGREAPHKANVAHGGEIFRAGVPDRGIPACATCHGEAGLGNENFPRLAGQHADYIIKQLVVFQRTEQRPAGVVMKTVAHDLKPADMLDVAGFLQSMEPH